MSYVYAKEKEKLYTDEGQRMFLRVRDRAKELLEQAGAVSCDKLLEAAGTGDSWMMLACVDRLVELGELHEVTGHLAGLAGQGRVYVRARG